MLYRALFCSAVLLMCLWATAEAHQPRLVEGIKTEVKNPEVSQAFYAELSGKAQTYVISAKERFQLYVQLTIPDHKGARRDFKVTIGRGKKILATLDGGKAKWKRFYEPFGGDYYLLGPDFEQSGSEPGDYEIRVSSRGNSGKYVLVFGRKEQFAPDEILRTVKIMPKVKEFMRPPPEPKSADRPGQQPSSRD